MNKLDVSLPSNPKYNELVKILSDKIFKEEFVIMNDYLKNLKFGKKKKSIF